MMAREVSYRTFPKLGISEAFHPASHHQNSPARLETLAKINAFHVSQVAYLLDRLKSTPDGDGTLLDHSLILYGSAMSNSNVHNHAPLPVLIAGGAAGRLKGGRHLMYPEGTPMSNLLLTILDKAGVGQEKVGDSTGSAVGGVGPVPSDRPDRASYAINRLVFLRCLLIGAMPALASAAGSDAADAAQRKDMAALRAMVTKRVNVNAPQADGTTALHWAAHWNDVEAVKLLLRAGANAAADEPVRRLAALGGRHVRQRRPGQGAARRGRRCEGAVHARRRDGADERGSFRQRGRRCGCCSIAAPT